MMPKSKGILAASAKPIAPGTPESGHRHHDVGVGRRLARELGADPLADLVDAGAGDDRIGPGEIDVLEDAEARPVRREGL